MNDDLQTYIEPEMEARLVALVLGEASAFEAGELERLMTEKPELRAYWTGLEKIHGVVAEAHEEQDDPKWKLSKERRGKIQAKIDERKRHETVEARRKRSSRIAQRRLIYACAACLVLTLVILVLSQPLESDKEEAAMMAESAEPKMSRSAVLAELEEAIIEQSDLVQDHRKDLTVLVQQYGVPYFDDGESSPLGTTEQQMFQNARQKLADLETEGDKLELEIKDKIKNGESGEEVGVLKNNLELVARQVSRMREMVSDRKEDTIELSLKQNRYAQAKDSYEDSREMLREMKKKRLEVLADLGEAAPAEGFAMKSATLSGLDTNSRRLDVAGALASLDEAMPFVDPTDETLSVQGTVSFGMGSDSIAATRTLEESQSFFEEPEAILPNARQERDLRESSIATDLPEEGRLFRSAGNESDSEVERKETLQTTLEGLARKPAAPASSASKAIAATTSSPSAIPVPELAVPDAPTDFGVGSDFGDGWGGNVDGGISGKEKLAERGKQRPDSVNLGDALLPAGGIGGGGASWDFELTDADEQAQKGRSDTRAALEKSANSPELYDLAPDMVTDSTEALRTTTAAVGLGFDDKPESDSKSNYFLGGGVVGGKASGNNRDFIETVDRVEIPGIPAPERNVKVPPPTAATPMPTDPTSDRFATETAERPVAANLDEVEMASSGSADKDMVRIKKRVVSGRETSARGGEEAGAYAYWASNNEKANIGRPDGEVELGIIDDGLSIDMDDDFEQSNGVANPGGSTGLIMQEAIRRESSVKESDEALLEGRKAYAEGDYETAVQKYREAASVLPAGTATDDRREFLNKSLADGSIALTQKYRRVGKYQEARDLLEEVVKNDPGSVEAQKGLEYLDDPIRTEASLTDEYTKDVDKVRRNLYKGESLYNLGLYDKADEEFKEVLRTDPYNKAARRWMERTSSIKSDYYRAAYDQTRAEMLMKVDEAWELAVPPVAGEDGDAKDSSNFLFGEDDLAGDLLPTDESISAMSNDGERSIISKGNAIIIPEVQFKKTTVEEALEFVRQRSIEFDNTTLDDEKKGVNIVVNNPEILSRVLPDIKLDEIPLGVLLEKIGEASGMDLTKDDFSYRFSKGEVPKAYAPSNDNDVDGVVITKLNQTILPEIKLKNSSISEALEYLRLRSVELDTTTLKQDEKGLEIVFENADLNKEFFERPQIAQLDLKNVPLRTAAEEIARLSGSKIRFEGSKVIFFADPAQMTEKLPEGFETSTTEKTDSTFSLNVSDVSFKLAKASLAGGSWPDASKVRPEEFVNALDYDDTKPTQAEKVACEIEQGAHPFMQQRNLMRIAMSTASLGRNASTPLRLTILLDQSGSMERADRVESVKRAFALLAAQLNANDEVTLVGFARSPRLLAERVKGNEMEKLAKIIANPLTEGGTNLEEALSSGLQLARQQFLKGAQNRIILLTDGAANLGDALPENLARQVESMRRANIAFDACGVGADGLNDDVLSSLAKQGDGRYYFLDRPEDADEGFARQIAGALRPAAKNVKVQILFNPDRVSTFKLYGYEKHKLKKEDFRNDSVDAAEMASEESGVALYHFEPLPEGRGDIGTVSVRFFDTASNEMVERTWAIPYLPSAPLFSEAEPTLRLASVAGLFAEKLKASPVGDRVDLKRLRQEVQSLRPNFQNQARFNEFQTMLQQAGE